MKKLWYKKKSSLHGSGLFALSNVKVLKSYAVEIGIPEKEWDEGVNKAVD